MHMRNLISTQDFSLRENDCSDNNEQTHRLICITCPHTLLLRFRRNYKITPKFPYTIGDPLKFQLHSWAIN